MGDDEQPNIDIASHESNPVPQPAEELASESSDEATDEPTPTTQRRGCLPMILLAAVGVLFVAVVALAVMVFWVIPRAGEAPTTAAQSAINKALAGVEARPNDVLYRLGLVDAYFQYQLYDEALVALDDARSLEPTGGLESYVEVGYGRVYGAMGDLESSKKHYEASLKLLETFDALYYLGNLAEESGDDAAAVDYWLRAIAISPERATLRLDIAKIYEAQKKYDLALQQLEEAARYLGDDPEVNAAIERVRSLADKQKTQ